jgi:predicted phage baseplate assembly protein
VYTTRRSDEGIVTVTFGDGVTGARLPSGRDNVVATYRVGIGSKALLPADRISIPLARPLGLQNVVNPVPAEGAADPETLDRARTAAPITVRTLGRVVSLADYEDAARTYAGIGKARADVIWDKERQVVHLTIAGPEGTTITSTSPVVAELRGALDEVRHSVVPIVVAPFTSRPFAVSARILVAPDRLPADVLAAVRAAVVDRFSFGRRDLARSVTQSEVVATMQNVPGVVAVVLLALHSTDWVATPTEPLPPRDEVVSAFPARVHTDATGTKILPAELVTVDPAAISLSEVGES